MSTENTEEGLKRVIGVPALAITVVNFSIGAAVYVLPALIGIQLGAASIFGYFLCALMFAAIVLCYAEVGSRVKTTGGSYAYVEAAFGPFAGFVVNWLFFFGWGILSDAAVFNIVADSLAVAVPFFANPFTRIILFLVLTGLMIFVNLRDTKMSVRVVEVFTTIKILPLLAIIVFGFGFIQWNYFKIDKLPSISALNDTAIILFFALAGFETSLNVSGEIKNPKRAVPRGILLGGILVLLIYVLIQAVTQGVLGNQLVEFKDAPLAGVAGKIAGATGITILLFAATFSGLVTLNGDILSSSRLLFAGAKDGLFPKYLARIHPRFATPYLAIITYASAIFIFSVSGGFKQLANLASGALLLIYLAVVLATIKLRMKKTPTGERTFRVPGGLIIPLIAIAAIIYVLSNLSRQELVSIAIFVAAICLVYL
jgi:amino acid transporter